LIGDEAMATERMKKIDFLARQNRGRHIKQEVARRFGISLRLPSDKVIFVDLELTDNLRAQATYEKVFSEAVVKCKSKGYYLYTEDKRRVDETVRKIREIFKDVPMILLHEAAEFTGGIDLNLHTCLDNYEYLAQLNGEDLIAVSNDLNTALNIEYFTDNTGPENKNVYRLAAWQA
jgi:hypothetical protein